MFDNDTYWAEGMVDAAADGAMAAFERAMVRDLVRDGWGRDTRGVIREVASIYTVNGVIDVDMVTREIARARGDLRQRKVGKRATPSDDLARLVEQIIEEDC